jgi:hypothetical protein
MGVESVAERVITALVATKKKGRRGAIPRHGHARRDKSTATYRSWQTMFHRATGGVVDRWNTFENFLKDMGPRPKGMQLGRKDTGKGFSPQNTVWISPADEKRNRPNVKWYKFKGKDYTAGQLAELTGIPVKTLRNRLQKSKKVEDALSSARTRRGKKKKK